MSRAPLPATWARLKSEQSREMRRALRIRAKAPGSVPLDPLTSAKIAGLRYVNDERTPGIRRLGSSTRVRYVTADNRPLRDRAALQRIKALAIPPAWTRVWICPYPNGHLQATGRDARGRKQYRYHPRWREVRDEVKYGRLIAFAQALPRIRQRTEADMTRPGLPREKVLATVVQLLEKTLIRVGNEEYARENGSIGLTTMRDGHAKVEGQTLRFAFRGKSGIQHAIGLQDRRLARVVKACRDLPGYELFQYLDDDGTRQVVDSADVNGYLREITGEDFSAKDFRTWAGTVMAARALAEVAAFKSNTEAKRNIVKAIGSVAKQLGNTKAVSRKCYIHPLVLESYLDGITIQGMKSRKPAVSGALSAEEAAVVALIDARLKKKTA